MKIAICAKQEDLKELSQLTMEYCVECNCRPVIESFENRESVIEAMKENNYSIVIVAMDRARGMETVKHIHRMDAGINIIWVSDDKDFAGSAFENGVKHFTVFPVTGEKLAEGLERCGISAADTNLFRVYLKADKH